MAAGNLSTPRVPDFKGLNDFKGKWYHSGLWPHEGVDFSGLRVGVIGTGSSGVQMIPLIAQQARHLTVFQRTANFSLPARNGPMRGREGAQAQGRVSRAPRPRRSTRRSRSRAIPSRPSRRSRLAEEERNEAYEAKWQEGGSISYLYAYTDLLVNKASNDTASEFVRNKIRAMVKDQKTAELLAPKDHPIGTKRLCLDTNYYETYNRPNVSPGRRALRSDRGDHRDRPAAGIGRGIRARRHRVRHRLRRHDRRAERDRRAHDRRRGAARALGRRAAHLSRPDGRGLPQHVRRHRPGQPGREDADDRQHRAARRLDRRCDRPSRPAPARPHRADAEGRERLGAARQPGRRFDALSAGQLLVHGRQYSRQAAGVHALCRRLRPLQEALRCGCGKGYEGFTLSRHETVAA